MTDEREPTCPLSDGAIDAVIDKHNDGSGCWRWADIVKICRDVAALSAARQSSAPGAAITLTTEQKRTICKRMLEVHNIGPSDTSEVIDAVLAALAGEGKA